MQYLIKKILIHSIIMFSTIQLCSADPREHDPNQSQIPPKSNELTEQIELKQQQQKLMKLRQQQQQQQELIKLKQQGELERTKQQLDMLTKRETIKDQMKNEQQKLITQQMTPEELELWEKETEKKWHEMWLKNLMESKLAVAYEHQRLMGKTMTPEEIEQWKKEWEKEWKMNPDALLGIAHIPTLSEEEILIENLESEQERLERLHSYPTVQQLMWEARELMGTPLQRKDLINDLIKYMRSEMSNPEQAQLRDLMWKELQILQKRKNQPLPKWLPERPITSNELHSQTHEAWQEKIRNDQREEKHRESQQKQQERIKQIQRELMAKEMTPEQQKQLEHELQQLQKPQPSPRVLRLMDDAREWITPRKREMLEQELRNLMNEEMTPEQREPLEQELQMLRDEKTWRVLRKAQMERKFNIQ